MKKHASDYVVGERFIDHDHDAGKVVSLMLDPTRSTRAYILVQADDGCYTIYSCLRDAVTNPVVARHVPQEVMCNFLFDAFTDQQELVLGPLTTRVPVRLPEFKPNKPTSVVVSEPLVPVVVDTPPIVKTTLLPELDFP